MTPDRERDLERPIPASPALTAGQRLGPYTVISRLGVGGMGEVYRAQDATLGREVAIKVLPALFTSDPGRLDRFEREARVLASLNHPNIATIHGLEHLHGVHVLVLEVVEGETLAERLQSVGRRGPGAAGRQTPAGLPIAEALTIARQIADALEAAHDKGIVHRDLKPANVKIRPDSLVKVLDFGLAKAAASDEVAASHTVSARLTRSGMILGTPAYMSPEQARGETVDARTDIWAFGCVLYEMLTGRPALGGDTIPDTLAAVLEHEPDWDVLPDATPPAVRRLLARCLDKDLRRRLRHIGDARIEIEDALTQPARPSQPAGSANAPQRRGRLAWVASLAVAVAAAAGTAWYVRRAPLEAAEVRLEINAPTTTELTSLAVSPDGRQVVFAATSDGASRLWLRSLGGVPPRPLPGTDNARFPFWSPDSRSVAFNAGLELKRVDVDTGSVRTITGAAAGLYGGAWNRDGTILLSGCPACPLFSVSVDGGEPVPATHVNMQTVNHRFPQFLPDQRHFLFYATGAAPGIYVGQLGASAPPRRLLDAEGAAYAPSGHLLFVRQGTLFAQAFDAEQQELIGGASAVAERIVVGFEPGNIALSISAAGPILYRSGESGPRSQFVWFDRAGKALETVAGVDASDGYHFALSRGGRRLAYSRISGTADVWLLDLNRRVASRLTSDPGFDLGPVWSPDNRRIAFSSRRRGVTGVYVRSADTSGNDEFLFGTDTSGTRPTDWSPDGRFILFDHDGPPMNIWALPVDPSAHSGDEPLDPSRKPFPVVATRFNDSKGQFSPDGRWIAYQSNESGRVEIYVQPFPGPGRRTLVSSDGGDEARWRQDGRELFYLAPDNRLMAVPIRLAAQGDVVDAGAPVSLFTASVIGARGAPVGRHYMASPDGLRFLMETRPAVTLPITVILNRKSTP